MSGADEVVARMSWTVADAFGLPPMAPMPPMPPLEAVRAIR
jgi:hypothetical protein